MQKSSTQSRPLKRRIVFVESDVERRSSSVMILGSIGYELVTAKSAIEFKCIFDSSSYGFADWDVNLPDQYGKLLAEYFQKILLIYIAITISAYTILKQMPYKIIARIYCLKNQMLSTLRYNYFPILTIAKRIL